MSSYLYNKFKDKYRVIADYDMDTMDFPRDYNGTIDSSFDDYYIPCKKNVEVRHGYRDILTCFVWSLMMGNNVVKAIYKLEIGDLGEHTSEWHYKKLKEKGVFTEYFVGGCECSFSFKAEYLPRWEGILKPKTYGRGIKPLSNKNLPKSDYVIPAEDLRKYKECIGKHPDGENKIAIAQFAKTCNSEFKKSLPKKAPTERKKLCMNFQQYVHYKGLWNKYIKLLEDRINDIE